MRQLYIVNPRSGGRLGQNILQSLQSEGEKHDSVSVRSVFDNSAADLIEEAKDYDSVIIAGGDGTISQLVARMGREHPPIGIIPLGTGNDLARELGIPNRYLLQSLERLRQYYDRAEVIEIQTWKALTDDGHEFPFCNYLSIGFDAEVIHAFDRIRKHRWYVLDRFGFWGNRLRYGLIGVEKVFSSRTINARCESGQSSHEFSGRSLFVANISSVMGLGRSSRESDPTDNSLELLGIHRYLQYGSFIGKWASKFGQPSLLCRSGELRISFEDGVILQVDGEAAPLENTREIVVRPHKRVKFFYNPDSARIGKRS